MKNTLLILIICSTRLFSQVNAPALRCLEVINGTGDVKLTWVPPSDPNGSFFAYEIYFSALPLGPFAQLTNTLSPINTFSFVHTNTVSTTQSGYYFMRTRYGLNGSLSSNPSDTLRTIFLNINTSTPDALKITFNDVHRPKLTSSATTFTLSREYPLGTWNVLSVTPLDIYNDTIAVCKANINYKVTLSDNSGCSSLSNINGGSYSDRHDPYEPVVDSISVLPNGNTVLAWKIPKDEDVIKYEIQQREGSINVPIALLNGRTTTSYILSGDTANRRSVGVFVKAIDSCSRGSLVDYSSFTMHAKTYYDYCAFQTAIRWNNYRWKTINGFPTAEVLEYRIYFSNDSGQTFKRVAVTTDTLFIHRNVNPGKPLCYFVRVINKRQTMTASSNRVYFYSGQVPAPNFVYIRTATINKKVSAQIQIYIDPTKPFNEMDLQRSKDGLTFASLKKITFSGLSVYTVDDEPIETEKQNYYYRVLVKDSCGNLRLQSNTARTILLRVVQDKENLFLQHLNWTDYLGFSGRVANYKVYRVVQDVNEVELIATTDSATTVFTDDIEEAASLGARIDYVVEAHEGSGNTYGLKELSKSNLAAVYIEGRIFVPNAFAPDGKNSTWKPVTHFIDKKDYNVKVFNRWGQKVFETFGDEEAWDGVNCISDAYVYLISYKNSRGEYQQVTGSVVLIR
ncbi:MAG: gliding motility-associated C-terminal domain-containing protein [bacterium]|nr:gliding motility-associated C-terminal domain-containing protein [bacterium]